MPKVTSRFQRLARENEHPSQRRQPTRVTPEIQAYLDSLIPGEGVTDEEDDLQHETFEPIDEDDEDEPTPRLRRMTTDHCRSCGISKTSVNQLTKLVMILMVLVVVLVIGIAMVGGH